MADLAQILSMASNGHPIEDHTGLTGRYNLVIDWIPYTDSKASVAYIDPNDPDPLSHWDIESVGLSRAPIKIPIDTLVIDHIERPSEN